MKLLPTLVVFAVTAITMSTTAFGQDVDKASRRMAKNEGISPSLADSLIGLTIAYKAIDLASSSGKAAARGLQASHLWEKAKSHHAHRYLNGAKGFLEKYPLSSWFVPAPVAGTQISESRMVCTRKGGCVITQTGNHN